MISSGLRRATIGGTHEVMHSDLGNRILAGLVRDGALLLAHGPHEAVVLLGNGSRVTFIDCAGRDSLAELTALFRAWVKQQEPGAAHLVALGESEDIAKAAKKAAPFLQFRTRLGFHQVRGAPAKAHRITGARFGQLDDLVLLAPSIPPLTAESYETLVAGNRAAALDASRLSRALDKQFPWVTAALVAACVVLFGLSLLWSRGNYTLTLLKMGANHGELVKDGEVWRFLSSAFLHGDFAHLAVNMIALLSFGPLLERILGAHRYLVLYALSALGGGLASALLRPEPVVAVGASGAIWGLMTAGIALVLRPRDLLPPLVIENAKRSVMVPLVINTLYSFMPGIDWLGHAGGGVVGFALLFGGVVTHGVVSLWREPTADGQAPGADDEQDTQARARTATSVWRIAGIAATLALAGSVALALADGKAWSYAAPPTFVRTTLPQTRVTFELPDALLPAKTQKIDDLFLHSFGSLDDQPCAVEILVLSLPAPVADDELAATLEREKTALENVKLEGATRDGPAALVKIGAKQTATVRHKINAVTLQSWLLIEGDQELLVRVYSLPDLPSAWHGLGEHIVRSLALGAK